MKTLVISHFRVKLVLEHTIFQKYCISWNISLLLGQKQMFVAEGLTHERISLLQMGKVDFMLS